MTPYANIDAYDTSEHNWSYVYLHGAAEDAMAYHYQVQDFTTAPDIFGADYPKPEKEGNYLVSVLDRPALAVIAMRHGIMSGRVALLTDTEGLAHALDIENWR